MNKLILGLASILMSCSITTKTEVFPGEYKGYILSKSQRDYGYDTKNGLKYCVSIVIDIDGIIDYNYTHRNKTLYDSIFKDEKVKVQGEAIFNNTYRKEKILKRKFLGLKVDSVWKDNTKYSKIMRWDEKEKIYKIVSEK